jgi:hypothetical protein
VLPKSTGKAGVAYLSVEGHCLGDGQQLQAGNGSAN